MNEFITKFFQSTGDCQNEFFSPATEDSIVELEGHLNIHLPKSYRDFLLHSNGFEGSINDFFVSLEPVETILATTEVTCKYFPWAVYIGTNGNLEMFVIDKRKQPYQFGLLPYIADDNDFIPLGDTFEKFINRLYNDTALKRNYD